MSDDESPAYQFAVDKHPNGRPRYIHLHLPMTQVQWNYFEEPAGDAPLEFGPIWYPNFREG